MTVDDSVMQKLWKLTNELTAQLVFNRNATLELKQQLADLQVQLHNGILSWTQGSCPVFFSTFGLGPSSNMIRPLY